jgi:hypothetical protein
MQILGLVKKNVVRNIGSEHGILVNLQGAQVLMGCEKKFSLFLAYILRLDWVKAGPRTKQRLISLQFFRIFFHAPHIS